MGSKEDVRTKKRRRGLKFAAVALIAELAAVRSQGYGFGGNVVVRCRDGHLFTTLWIPGASIKSLRLGFWRVQRCPVGNHWSVVRPVRKSELTEAELQEAASHHDVRVP